MLITDFNFHVTDCVEQNRPDPSRMPNAHPLRNPRVEQINQWKHNITWTPD